MSSLFTSSTAMSSLLAAARYQSQGVMMSRAFASMNSIGSDGMYDSYDPFDSGAYAFPVMDQMALTSITQAGLSNLFGSVNGGEAMTADQFASNILGAAGWDAGESSFYVSSGYGGLVDIFG